jgi:hypothetical protein
MASYRRNQELLMETPPSIPEEFSPDRERAQAVVRSALAEGRSALREVEAEELLLAYGLEVARSRFARGGGCRRGAETAPVAPGSARTPAQARRRRRGVDAASAVAEAAASPRARARQPRRRGFAATDGGGDGAVGILGARWMCLPARSRAGHGR